MISIPHKFFNSISYGIYAHSVFVAQIILCTYLCDVDVRKRDALEFNIEDEFLYIIIFLRIGNMFGSGNQFHGIVKKDIAFEHIAFRLVQLHELQRFFQCFNYMVTVVCQSIITV